MRLDRGIAMVAPVLLWLAALAPVVAHQDHDHHQDHGHHQEHGHDHGHGDASQAAQAAEQRSHGVHVHGIAMLNLALEGGELHIEVASPAANLVGFERAPASPAEQAALADAEARLRDGARLFGFADGAGCGLAVAEVTSPLLDSAAAQAHDHAAAAGHAGHAHGQPDEAHADILASYRFECADPARLTGVTVRLFEAFPGVEKLQVQYLTDGAQGAAELTAKAPVLAF